MSEKEIIERLEGSRNLTFLEWQLIKKILFVIIVRQHAVLYAISSGHRPQEIF